MTTFSAAIAVSNKSYEPKPHVLTEGGGDKGMGQAVRLGQVAGHMVCCATSAPGAKRAAGICQSEMERDLLNHFKMRCWVS